MVPPKLQPGDRVRYVSPASPPDRKHIEENAELLESYGLVVEFGKHAFDRNGYFAGTDDDRAADMNDALRDPGVKAIMATRGGKGAYRIADRLDVASARKNPKLLIGFSEITILHLALYKHCSLAGVHAGSWNASFSHESVDSLYRALCTDDSITVQANQEEPSSSLTTEGAATGVLIGGNQDMIATAAGWALPSFDGAILLLEASNLRLGQIDRQLTMLMNAGHLKGVRGVAVGQYTGCGSDAANQGDWTAIDVLRDRLGRLNVPMVGGLPIGHGEDPIAIPVGTMATLDARSGTLTVAPAVG